MDWFDREPAAGRRQRSACPADSIGDQLKGMFDTLTAGPMPDRLTQLAEALDDAFQRGALSEPKTVRRRAVGS